MMHHSTSRLVFVGASMGALVSTTLVGTVIYRRAQTVRHAVREVASAGKLARTTWVIEDYWLTHGYYPPAYIADNDGKPIHSWRALLLPLIDERQLERAYRFDEPWNGPNNSLLNDRSPALFRSPGDHAEPHEWTRIVAFLGPHGLLRESKGVKYLRKRPEDTIALVFIPAGLVQWLEPRDLPLPPADPHSKHEASNAPFSTLPSDPIVVFADRRYFKIRRDMDFGTLGDWTRDDLLRLGIIYPLPEREPLSTPLLVLLSSLAVLGVVCIVVAVKAGRALRNSEAPAPKPKVGF